MDYIYKVECFRIKSEASQSQTVWMACRAAYACTGASKVVALSVDLCCAVLCWYADPAHLGQSLALRSRLRCASCMC